MSSERQRRANQRNAQHSTGPRTDEGKQNSCKNAIRHGLFAKSLTFTPEEAIDFDRLVDGYIKHFRPSDPIEADLVEELAMAKMRQKRVWRLEADLLRIELGRQREAHEKDYPEEGPDGRLVLAVEWLADESRTLEYLRRVEGQLRRSWERCLLRLEARRPPEPPENKEPEPEPKKVKNEPIPTTGHSGLTVVQRIKGDNNGSKETPHREKAVSPRDGAPGGNTRLRN